MPAAAISSNMLLDALGQSDYGLLRGGLTKVRMTQNAVLQEAGKPVEQVYFPLSGMISLLATFTTGEAIEIAAVGREGAVGMKVGLPCQFAFAKAIVQLPGTALRIDIVSFQKAALRSLAITHLATCANDIMSANLQQSAGCNAIHGLEARLARWLLHARDRYDSDYLPLTHEFLSQMLGVRRSTVTLAAETLKRAGAIQYRRGRIELHDRPRLESMSCECYRAVKSNVEAIMEFAKLASTVSPEEA